MVNVLLSGNFGEGLEVFAMLIWLDCCVVDLGPCTSLLMALEGRGKSLVQDEKPRPSRLRWKSSSILEASGDDEYYTSCNRGLSPAALIDCSVSSRHWVGATDFRLFSLSSTSRLISAKLKFCDNQGLTIETSKRT